MKSKSALALLAPLLVTAAALPAWADVPACAAPAPGSPVGLQDKVVFAEYSPLSRSEEVVRRLLSPLDAMRVMREAQAEGKRLADQVIDLANERFAIYVPAHAPPRGYSLLVYVPPWERALVPLEWTSVLERHGMIYVSAANSGNSQNVLDRREPLALLAVRNIMSRYAVDPDMVYVGGFSGGARVALRLALGYPDIFRGVLLNAGSDPIGTAHTPLPVAQLFDRFQESTQVVYATGERDSTHLAEDTHSRRTMQQWCVFDVTTRTVPQKAHELPDASNFDHLLDALTRQRHPNSSELAVCRARIGRDLDRRLGEVERLVEDRKLDGARRSLDEIDASFGGLAVPRSIELARAWMRAP
jgi:dienelactone hydrolase